MESGSSRATLNGRDANCEIRKAVTEQPSRVRRCFVMFQPYRSSRETRQYIGLERQSRPYGFLQIRAKWKRYEREMFKNSRIWPGLDTGGWGRY